MLHYITLPYITLHCITLIAPPHMQLQLYCTNCTTPQLQLRHTTSTTTAALHHTTSSSCRWPLQPFQKHSSNHLSVHRWICSATRDSQQPTSPLGFLFLKLPPPPCAVLLVWHCIILALYSEHSRWTSSCTCVCARGHANPWSQMKPRGMDAAGFEPEGRVTLRHD